jgi:putative ABC transport system substrate-binding protein
LADCGAGAATEEFSAGLPHAGCGFGAHGTKSSAPVLAGAGIAISGYVENRSFEMEDRNADGNLGRLPALAADLARVPVDIIVAGGEAPVRAAMQATDKIPIVMTISADPISSGIVSSLARPGGNVTGMSALASDMAGKRVELLKEIIPRAARIAVLWNSNNKSKVEEWKDTQTVAKTTGLTLISAEARTAAEFAQRDLIGLLGGAGG